MKRKLIVLSVLILLTFSLTAAAPPAKCADSRCTVAKSWCGGQADLFNQLCVATGGTPAQCFQQYFIGYYQQCLAENGC